MNMIILLTALTFAAEPSGEATDTPAQNKTSQEAPKSILVTQDPQNILETVLVHVQ